ncbi:hypothetical protein C8Q70DRAFT_951165 [Cubamyces menziesii]|nr:hypothetical protein C8Q70DRAFT_951165 [Cubamyces menziesii]
MSSLAGPSSHAFSSFSVQSQQPTAISTKLRRVTDVDSTPSSATTPPTTVPPTPVVRAQSVAETDGREQSQDRQVNGNASHGQDVSIYAQSRRPQDLKASVVADLDAVRARTAALSRKRDRTIEEEAAMVHTATRIASRLAEDQRTALVPDVETPFVDGVDVVQRLLPYHVFQQPKEDLDTVLQTGSVHPSRKGKRKATEEDLLREEIADTRFALECWKRRRDLERRFRKARIHSGKQASPDDQGYFLAQAVLEIERADTAMLQQELRAARQELDKIEREKRLAAPPPPATPSTASASRPTMNVRTANYYNPSAPSTPTQTPTTATFMPPYRPYTYSYSQYPTTQYTYNPHAYNTTPYATTTSNAYGTTPTTTTPAATPTTYTPTANAATTTSTSAASAQVQQAQAYPYAASNTAIPVQLPVSSLNALSALGIVPLAAGSVPSAGQPQPPAVIKSTNGSMLNLEINLSLLQSAQMSGLALILNALTSRGVNVDGSPAGTGAVASTIGGTVASASTNDTGVSASAGVSATTGQPTNGAPSSATPLNGAASVLAPPNTTGAASTTSPTSAGLAVPDSTASTTESKVTAPPST